MTDPEEWALIIGKTHPLLSFLSFSSFLQLSLKLVCQQRLFFILFEQFCGNQHWEKTRVVTIQGCQIHSNNSFVYTVTHCCYFKSFVSHSMTPQRSFHLLFYLNLFPRVCNFMGWYSIKNVNKIPNTKNGTTQSWKDKVKFIREN